jgi:hypothetical protein
MAVLLRRLARGAGTAIASSSSAPI